MRSTIIYELIANLEDSTHVLWVNMNFLGVFQRTLIEILYKIQKISLFNRF